MPRAPPSTKVPSAVALPWLSRELSTTTPPPVSAHSRPSIADELIAVEAWAPVNVVELPDSVWAVDVPGAAGADHGVVIVARIMGSDIDSVRWELSPRSRKGGPKRDAPPLVVEFLGSSLAWCTSCSPSCGFPRSRSDPPSARVDRTPPVN